MSLPEETLGRSYDAGLMRRMLGYLRPRRGLSKRRQLTLVKRLRL